MTSPKLTLVARGMSGEPANGRGYPAVLSDDGMVIAFSSDASNLVPDDTNGVIDAFVHNRRTGATQRVNVSSDGEQANGVSLNGHQVSGNGRFTVFVSSASNLVPGDTNGAFDVFTHDLRTGITERVSVGNDGHQATDAGGFRGYRNRITDDGNVIAFEAMGLDPAQPNTWSIYLWDRRVHRLVPIPGGTPPSGTNVGDISGDGRILAYLTPGRDSFDVIPDPQVPIFRDLRTGVDDRILTSHDVSNQYSVYMDERGRMISWAGRDSSGLFEAFLADRRTRRIDTMASSWGPAGVPAISGNGRYLVVVTDPPDPQGDNSLLSVLDRRRGTTRRVGIGLWSDISDDGRTVVLELATVEGPFLWIDPRPR